jgi:hypothetical protein
MRINITDSSVSRFGSFFHGDCRCDGDVMALSDDGSTLFVGYRDAACVAAYSISTLEQIWLYERLVRYNWVNSVSFHAGMVLVGTLHSDFVVLSAADGTELRKLYKANNWVLGHAVILGLFRFGVNSSFLLMNVGNAVDFFFEFCGIEPCYMVGIAVTGLAFFFKDSIILLYSLYPM